ncbi:MAG: nucleotide exchange factor GrpE [Steroidobacteraceae bacterium]
MAEAETGTPEAVEPAEDLAARLAAAEARAKECQDQYLRTLAEIDNVRKRAQRDIEAANRYGLERFAQELLPVKEGLDLAVENAAKADRDSLAAGQLATRQLLSKAFERLGIVELNPVGEPFDPTVHEAMMVQPSATAEPDTVLTVVQRGYALNGRLLRPARVIVATAAGGA